MNCRIFTITRLTGDYVLNKIDIARQKLNDSLAHAVSDN